MGGAYRLKLCSGDLLSQTVTGGIKMATDDGEVNFRVNMPIWWDDPDAKPGVVSGKKPSKAGTIVSVNKDNGTALVTFYNADLGSSELLISLDELRPRTY